MASTAESRRNYRTKACGRHACAPQYFSNVLEAYDLFHLSSTAVLRRTTNSSAPFAWILEDAYLILLLLRSMMSRLVRRTPE